MNITILSAGAGSGKTYTLTGRMVGMLENGVRAGGIIATTFTQKSAAELQERVRVRLLEAGLSDAANALGSALIGTVHSIGVRLLQRFAFEAGVSPLVEIIADGDEQRLFNESLAQVLSEARIETMNRLADRLGLTKKTAGDPFDWRRLIRNLTDVARANNFSRSVLETSKRHSWESFEKLLPQAQDADANTWHNRLISRIDQTTAALEANETDQTKATREAVETLRNFQNQLKWRGELYWHEWVKIAKTEVGAKSRDLFADLQAFALQHDENQQFHEDVKLFIDTVFDIAIDALHEYEQYKKKRGLIDYTDMETYVSSLLRVDNVRETLRQEIDLLLVDEFQDTSPIQLDIFLQLSRLARHSIWVGDPKQSIYGFRGAEPALMQAIIRATGGIRDENILKHSWRSRPDIVHAVNAIFTKAFNDLPAAQVALAPAPATLAVEEPPEAGWPLLHWHFKSELDERRPPGAPWLENGIAQQIRVLLERQTPVFSKKRDQSRPVQPGDIAVLCRSNDECARMAEALHRAGLKAALARAGLLETPEAKLVLACLKYLLTATDHLSVAEILLLTGQQNLEEVVRDRIHYLLQLQNNDNPARWAAGHPFISRLNDLRSRTADLSASEILNLLIDELDLRRIAVRLGNPAQRLDNIDRMRHYALEYEAACQRLHNAASLSGFLLWMSKLTEQEDDMQGSGENAGAVRVLTYHKSKGLEFPVTVCHSLDQGLREQVWGVNLVSETDEPDLDDILGKRWLRFWVNPYADQLRGTRLEETLHQSEAWASASRQARAEEARLLYVGLTRARDYLVFPTTMRSARWLNRVFNHGDESIPTLDPHSDETPFYWQNEVIRIQTELIYQPKDFPEAVAEHSAIRFHGRRAGKSNTPRPGLNINTQTEHPPGFHGTFDPPQAFAPWLEFRDEFSPAMMQAVRAFLQTDVGQTNTGARLAMARKQLAIRQLATQITPEALVRQSDAFRKWYEAQFSPTAVETKYPVQGWPGGRSVNADADFLLKTDDMLVILQLANFSKGVKKWEQQAQALTPTLGWLQVLLQKAYPGRRVSSWVVFPVEGQVLRLNETP